MKSLPDSNTAARQMWLRTLQNFPSPTPPQKISADQSDFEKSLAFRSALLVAAFVIAINVLPPASVPLVAPTSHTTA